MLLTDNLCRGGGEILQTITQHAREKYEKTRKVDLKIPMEILLHQPPALPSD